MDTRTVVAAALGLTVGALGGVAGSRALEGSDEPGPRPSPSSEQLFADLQPPSPPGGATPAPTAVPTR